MKLERLAGILLHPTSLPGKYGIGDFGKGVFEFIDFLKKSNQVLWQVLPLSPTGFGDSPYQSFSTFAGNTLLISPDELIKEGYLPEAFDIPQFNDQEIDYGEVIKFKNSLYKEAFSNFKSKATKNQKNALKNFIEQNVYWLKDYTLFMSIKEHFINKRKGGEKTREYEEFKIKAKKYLTEKEIDDYFFGAAWVSWPSGIRERNESAMKSFAAELFDEIEYNAFLQYEFFRQWAHVKEYAEKNGVQIICDIPIFIAFDSADCWANKKLFYLDSSGFPLEVAGVPPDYFSETGQLWGNPLYNWDVFEKVNYQWWINRIKKTREMCDYVRIDHFRGFDTYWSIPFGDKTAVNGKWKIGPKEKLFDAINSALGELPIIAEDLGEMFDSVYALKDHYNLPGMKVLQFAFDDGSASAFLPHNFENSNFVVYTGTHDNDTTVGWFSDASDKTKDYVRRYLNVDGSSISWDLIRLAYMSIAAFVIIPLQDCLMLSKEARMNMPGVASGNWKWRYKEDALNDGISAGLSYYTKLYGRCAGE